jgi:protein Mpv17
LSVVDTTAVIDNFFQSQPYLSAFLTCSVKATAADVLAQVKESGGSGAASKTATSSASSQNDNDSSLSLNADTPGPRFDDGSNEAPAPGQHSASADLDWQRTSAFLFYGGLYQGLFQEFLYAGLFPKWFPSGDWQSVVAQVALDMTFFTVCLCLPVAYIFKTLFMAREKVTASGSAATPSWRTVQTALRKYKGDVQERGLLFKYWQIWIPAQSFNFVFVPTHYRVAFVAIVSFFWMFVLSVTSAQGDEEGCES